MDGGGETTTTTTTTTTTSSSSGDASGRATTSATSAAGNTSADVSAAFALTLSVVSSVSIVIVNKHLISILGFREVTFLTAMHMVVTAVVLRMASKMGYFERKSVGRGEVMKFGVLNSASIALLNLSLGFNSVGFYQMSKLTIIPVTVVLQMTYFKKKFSARVKFSLAVLLLGVGASTVTDVQLNPLGSIVGALSVITTSLGQILTGSLQTKLQLSSTQLLCAASPWMALTLMILAPPVDGALTGGNILESYYDSNVYLIAFISCLLAIAVNFASFAVIGKCSAVTYQVVGHLKTILVLGFGFVVIGNPVVAKNVLGLLVAMIGMVLYARAEMLDRAVSSSAAPSSGVPPQRSADVESGSQTK